MNRAPLQGSRAWAWPLAAWTVAYLPRPFLLGFVSDDWTNLILTARDTRPWSAERWEYFAGLFLNRPVAAPLQFLLSSVCDDSPALWALCGAVVALLVAVAVRAMLLELSRLLGADGRTAAELATAVWLLAPWAVGATAWAISVALTISAAFFALSGACLLRGWRRGETAWLSAALFFGLSCLSYESFYGQFVALLGIGAAAGVHRRLGARALARPAIAFVVVQIVAVAWNRLAPRVTGAAINKPFDPAWYVGIAKNLILIPVALYEGAAEVFWLIAAAGVLVLVLAARGWRAAPEELRTRTLGALAACALGAAGAVGVLALAAYRLYGAGHDSRTTFGLSFWLAAMLVPLLLLAARGATAGGARVYRWRHYGAALTLAALGVSNVARMTEWARAWRLGRSTLAALPVGALRGASADAVVLHVGPWQVAGVLPLAQVWAMTPAVWSTHPELRHLRFYAARDFATRWDGATVEQRPTFVPRMLRLRLRLGRVTQADVAAYRAAAAPEVRVPARELWVWEERSGRVTRAASPFEHPGVP